MQGGLLGADYAIENGRYRFAKIYNGGELESATAGAADAAGRERQAGEYLLAVNGDASCATENVYQLLRGRPPASRSCSGWGRIRMAAGSREVTVVPVGESKTALRQPGLDRRQPPQGRPDHRRPGGVRASAGHRQRRLHQLQPLLLRAGGKEGASSGRALQPRRRDRGLHHRLPAAASAEHVHRGKARRFLDPAARSSGRRR